MAERVVVLADTGVDPTGFELESDLGRQERDGWFSALAREMDEGRWGPADPLLRMAVVGLLHLVAMVWCGHHE